MSKLLFGAARPWLDLFRVFQCSMTGLLGIVGYEAQSAPMFALSVELCFVFAFIFFACASANVINDIRDFRSDSIQHPMRPLPSGRISRTAARAAFIWAAGIAFSLASLFGERVAVATSCVIAIGVLYSVRLKSTVLVGNAIVACTAASALPLGAIARGIPRFEIYLAYGLLALFMFSFEILKTLRDREGDTVAGYLTVAVVYGERATLFALRASVACLTVASLSLVFFHAAWLWALVLFFCAVLPSTILVYRLPFGPTGEAIVLTLRRMRMAWIPGIAALGIWLWQVRAS